MHTLVRTIFRRLHCLDPVLEEAKLQVHDDDPQEGEIKLTVSGGADLTASSEHGHEATVSEKPAKDGEMPAVTEKEGKPDQIAYQEDSLSAAPKPECRFSCFLRSRY